MSIKERWCDKPISALRDFNFNMKAGGQNGYELVFIELPQVLTMGIKETETLL